MRTATKSILLSTIAALPSTVFGQLSLASNFSGQSFFDGFRWNESVIDYFNYGNVHYLGQNAAQEANLTYINSQGNAIIKVDNTTSGAGDPTFGRNSVTLISQEPISQGSLVVLDALHLPFGCSVWPAFWLLNSVGNMTDDGGEIDIFEGVNQVTSNQYTLHTASGCNQVNSSSLPYANSTVVSTNCNHLVNSNQGCAFIDDRPISYGSEFASNGGGVFAALWNADGIQIWFFPRDLVPTNLIAGSPDTTTWGAPAASYPAVGCDPSKYFNPQNLIININICGSYAGNSVVFGQTCSGVCTDLVADPSNYDNAYFEIASVQIYTGGSTGDNSSSQSTEGNASDNTSMVQGTSSATQLSVFGATLIPVILGVLTLALLST